MEMPLLIECIYTNQPRDNFSSPKDHFQKIHNVTLNVSLLIIIKKLAVQIILPLLYILFYQLSTFYILFYNGIHGFSAIGYIMTV